LEDEARDRDADLPAKRSAFANDRWSKREQNSVHQYCCTLVLERDVQLDKVHIHTRME
jgi:hypothetical protein